MASGAAGPTEWLSAALPTSPAAGPAASLAAGSMASMAAGKERPPLPAAGASWEETEFDSTSVASCSPKPGSGCPNGPNRMASGQTLDRSRLACGSAYNPISYRSTPTIIPNSTAAWLEEGLDTGSFRPGQNRALFFAPRVYPSGHEPRAQRLLRFQSASASATSTDPTRARLLHRQLRLILGSGWTLTKRR